MSKSKSSATYSNVLANGLKGKITPLLSMSDTRLGRVSKKVTGLLCNEDYAEALPVELFPMANLARECIDKSSDEIPSIRVAFYELATNRYPWVFAWEDADAGWLMRNVILTVIGHEPIADQPASPQGTALSEHLNGLLEKLGLPVAESAVELQQDVNSAVNELIAHNCASPEERDFLAGLVVIDWKEMERSGSNYEFNLPTDDPVQYTSVLAAKELMGGVPFKALDLGNLAAAAQELMGFEPQPEYGQAEAAETEPEEPGEAPAGEAEDEDDENEAAGANLLLEDETGWY